MRIGAAQLNTRTGDFENTAKRIVELSQNAAEQGIDLLVFSFTTLTGTFAPDYPDSEGYRMDLFSTLSKIAGELSCSCVIPALGEIVGSSAQEAYILHNGEVRALRKHKAAAFGNAHQHPYAPEHPESYSRPELITFKFKKIYMGIAFSYHDIETFVNEEAKLDALLFISQHSFAIDDPASAMGAALSENRFRSDAITLDSWIVGVGSVGGYGLLLYPGSSFVMSPDGKLVSSAPAFEEALISAEICPSEEYTMRDPFDDAALISPEIFNRSLHLWEALSLGLHDYVVKQSLENVALLLDGGLNSSVLVALATDALGPTHVFALIAPQLEAERDEAARKLAKSLRVTTGEASIEIPASADKSLREDLCQADLAAFARAHNALVLGTQDKTFLALEAQGANVRAANLMPLGDVYRTDVLELAHMRNTISPVMPARIFTQLEVPEIEGLKEAESTPKLQLECVDVTLANRIEWERSLTDVVARQGNPELTARIVHRLCEGERARMSWPACLIMTSRTLYDAHNPLDMAWQDVERGSYERTSNSWMPKDLYVDSEEDAPETHPFDFSKMMEDSDSDALSSQFMREISPAEIESSLGDLLSLLKDMIQEGGFKVEGQDGPMGPHTWGSPFSEN